MEIAAGSVSEEGPVWPAGVERVRLSERPDLAGALYAAWNKAFAGHWGSQAESEAEFWEERRDAKAGSASPFEPELWLLALDRGEVAGFCLCELGTSEGESVGRVAEIGVVPAQRGAGLGFALLRDGFQGAPPARSDAGRARRRRGERHERAPALRESRNDPAARVHGLGEGGEVGGYRPSGTLRVTVVPPPGRLLI